MSWGVIEWHSGDLIDVTRMNQYHANDQYLTGLFAKVVLFQDSRYWTETIGSNLNEIYLKIDSTQVGGVASADTVNQQYYVQAVIPNVQLTGLTNGVEYDLYLHQGHDNYLTSFVKSSNMNYLTYFVTVTRRDGTWGRLNLSVLVSTEPIAT